MRKSKIIIEERKNQRKKKGCMINLKRSRGNIRNERRGALLYKEEMEETRNKECKMIIEERKNQRKKESSTSKGMRKRRRKVKKGCVIPSIRKEREE